MVPFIRFSKIIFIGLAFFTLSMHPSLAVTFSDVSVDRSEIVANGTGFMSATSSGISISSFGPTVTETLTGAALFPSITLNNAGTGSVSFTGFGFPPPVVLGGTISDFRSSASLIELLFVNSTSGSLFVADISSSVIAGSGLSLNAPFLDPVATISVYSAFEPSVAPIPLPAAGWMLLSALLIFRCCLLKRRPA